MNTWKVILATLVIFGTGAITGGLLVSYSDRALRPAVQTSTTTTSQNPPVPTPPAPTPPGTTVVANPAGLRGDNRMPPLLPVILRKEFLDRLEHEVKVDAGQRERIEKVISEGQERNREVSQQTMRKIRAELNPEQRMRFEDLMKRSRDPRKLPPRGRPPTTAPSNTVADPAK